MANTEYTTRTRRLIMDFMSQNSDRIFKASEIAQSLPSVSLSTVYRNLARLEKSGALQIVGADTNNELRYRFVGARNCKSKLHLICKCCGKFFHIDGPLLNLLMNSVLHTSGFVVDKQDSILLGRCANCNLHRK